LSGLSGFGIPFGHVRIVRFDPILMILNFRDPNLSDHETEKLFLVNIEKGENLF